MYTPDDCLMLSGLQHFRFCRRQWALIHIEQQWAENLRTVEGEFLHERAHNEQLRPTKSCNACSLKELCLPRLQRSGSVQDYLRESMEDEP